MSESSKAELEYENIRLENSMQSIARAVMKHINEADDTDVYEDTDQAMFRSKDETDHQIQALETPLKNIRPYLTSSTPNLESRNFRFVKSMSY